jgi:hypothetical protein
MSSHIARSSISGTGLTPQDETGFLATLGRERNCKWPRNEPTSTPVVLKMASTEKPSVNRFSIEDAARVAAENCLNKGGSRGSSVRI